MAFAKAQLAANQRLPQSGAIFVSMNDALKERSVPVVRGFADLGFTIYATGGTAAALRAAGISVQTVLKLHEGRPHIGSSPMLPSLAQKLRRNCLAHSCCMMMGQ
jgi:carbamoyl-phosphate synthase large subunit